MGEIAEVVGGGTPRTTDPSNYEDGRIPWITPADLSGYTAKYIGRGARSITQKGLDTSSARMIPAGSVLFTSRAPIGYVAIASNDVCTNQGFKSFVLKTKDILPDYVYWWLKGNKDLAEGYASGTTFLELSGAKAKQLPIPLAPPDQQKRIVAEIEKQFSRLDGAVANLKRVKANLKRYKAAVLGKLTEEWRNAHPDVEPASELLKRILADRRAKWEQAQFEKMKAAAKQSSDGKWRKKYKELSRVSLNDLPPLPGQWEWVTWETVLALEKDSFKRGPFGSALTKSIFVKSGYKVYEQYCPINDDCSFARYFITKEKFKEMEASAVRARDFLISCSGVTLGRITQVPTDFEQGIINQALLRVRLNNDVINDTFFKMLFRSPYFQKQIFQNATGSAIPNVKSVNELKAIALPLPPVTEQEEIVQEIETRMSVVKVTEDQLDADVLRTERLRQTLLTKAFSGKLLKDDKARSSLDSEHFGPM